MKNNKIKLIVLFLMIFLITGCATRLQDENKKAVTNPKTGQNLIENILCQPANQETIDLYVENGVDIESLPKCSEFSSFKGEYEGLWNSVVVKPISHLVLFINTHVNNAGWAIIFTSVIIRLILFPVSLKSAEQSENMKKARPDMERIEKKYANKTDKDAILKKSQELSLIYKKHGISQSAGCLTALIQIPLLFGMIEAIQRLPILYEGQFILMNLGTTFIIGLRSSSFYVYLIFLLLIGATTYFSMKYASKDAAATTEGKMMGNMAPTMTIIILISALFLPTATALYWITSNVFTIGQNMYVERRKNNGKENI